MMVWMILRSLITILTDSEDEALSGEPPSQIPLMQLQPDTPSPIQSIQSTSRAVKVNNKGEKITESKPAIKSQIPNHCASSMLRANVDIMRTADLFIQRSATNSVLRFHL